MSLDRDVPKSGNPARAFAKATTILLGLLLLFWGAVAIVEAQGVPDIVMGAFVITASTFAIPAIAHKAAMRFSIASRSFGPVIAMVAVTVGGLVCFFIGVGLEKRFDPEAAAAREARAATLARNREEADNKLEAERRKAAQHKEETEFQSAPNERAGTEQAFNGLWTSVTGALEPCEQAQQSLGQQLRNGSFSAAAYREAESGRQSCFSAYRKLQTLSPPFGISGDSEAATKTGLENCASAAMARMTFFDIASDIIDGERQPSRLAAAQAQNDAAKAATLQCVAHIIDGATKAGVKITQK